MINNLKEPRKNKSQSHDEPIEIEDVDVCSLKIDGNLARKQDRYTSLPAKDLPITSKKLTVASNKDTTKSKFYQDSNCDLVEYQGRRPHTIGTLKSFSLTKSFIGHRNFFDINGPISAEIFFSIKSNPIKDDYEIGTALGEGSYGEVKLGVHKRTKMARAIKIIKKTAIIKQDEELIMKEVEILKSLDHPNIIKIYDMYQDDANIYMVIE